jgi:hypothetical protein
MLVGTPLVETEQDRSFGVEDLAEVVVGRNRFFQASLVKERGSGMAELESLFRLES